MFGEGNAAGTTGLLVVGNGLETSFGVVEAEDDLVLKTVTISIILAIIKLNC